MPGHRGALQIPPVGAVCDSADVAEFRGQQAEAMLIWHTCAEKQWYGASGSCMCQVETEMWFQFLVI